MRWLIEVTMVRLQGVYRIVKEKENDCVSRGLFYRTSGLERVMRKASLKAHTRLDKGNVSSN